MERFGRYVLLQPLGRGGMAEVHLARRDGAERVCVLKLLRVEHRNNANLLSRLKREAHLLSYLDHPNVAQILDAGVEDGVFYLSLEHIPGHTLRSVMKKCEQRGRPMPVGAALAIGLAVLDGLAYAHDLRGPEGRPLGVVHRDLSPNNIMVGGAGQVKIIDFGLAFAKVDHFQTNPGVVLGTFRYSAPEQVETGQVDKRSDLYALATVLYEAITGRAVVNTHEAKEIMQAVLAANPPPFHEIMPDLPPSLWEVVRAGLAKDPRDRPQDAREFADRLRRAAEGLPIFSPELLGQSVAVLFALDADTSITWTSMPDTLTAETTASETSAPSGTMSRTHSGSVSITKELPRIEPPRPKRRIPWLAAALLCAVIMPLSFVAVRLAMLPEAAPIIIDTVVADDLPLFEKRVRVLLAEGRYRDASDAMSTRAEDRLATHEALEINRMLYDASTRGEWKSLDRILASQVSLERGE